MKKLVKLLTLTLCMVLLISYVPSNKAPLVTSSNTVTTGNTINALDRQTNTSTIRR